MVDYITNLRHFMPRHLYNEKRREKGGVGVEKGEEESCGGKKGRFRKIFPNNATKKS